MPHTIQIVILVCFYLLCTSYVNQIIGSNLSLLRKRGISWGGGGGSMGAMGSHHRHNILYMDVLYNVRTLCSSSKCALSIFIVPLAIDVLSDQRHKPIFICTYSMFSYRTKLKLGM